MFIAHGKEDALVTLNLTPGKSVYNEKRIAVEEVRPPATAPPRGAAEL